MRIFGVTAALITLFSASPSSAISTHHAWDGTQSVWSFGCGFVSSNYGQVITVKKHEHTLESFSFWMANNAPDLTSGVLRAEVYEWDGQKANGDAVFESEPRTVTFTNTAFVEEKFIANVAVQPGKQYILFLTTDKDRAGGECGPGPQALTTKWGAVADTYKGGAFYFLDTGGIAGNWTVLPWSSIGASYDLVFVASFSK